MPDLHSAEDVFYSRYDWCLNPIPSVQELLHRFAQEINDYPTFEGWQREECQINLYLFACAIACTVDDYFSLRLLDLSPLYSCLPRLLLLLRAAEWLLNTGRWLLTMIVDWRVWQWRKQWNSCLEQLCSLLIAETEFRRVTPSAPTNFRLPKRLLKWRMRLPEAFRGQDFTHHDVISLIRRFCASSTNKDKPIVIVGLRTAGAYFAPLMALYLKRSNWLRVAWFSIRPKNGISVWEQWQLRFAARHDARVLVVDDYPATGKTLRLTLQILQKAKIKPERISVLAPTHAAETRWMELAGIKEGMTVFTVRPTELYKAELLKPKAVESWCAEYFASSGSTGFRVIDDDRINRLNARLAEHSKQGHHVREKRVFAIELSDRYGRATRKEIFFKSAGWGWLGYHAYIAGRRLDGFVPQLIGLRNGLLVTAWIDETRKGEPCSSGAMVNVVASYVAARRRRLPLIGDCRHEKRTYRWSGVDEIVTILRAAYGPFLGRLKAAALRKQVYAYLSSTPTLIDGRMRSQEWLRTPTAVFKADFEHHNFGGAELDIADPAYDLAAAVFEFQWNRESEEQLLATYMRMSGDRTAADRMIIYKILYASMAMRHAEGRVMAGKEAQKHNDLFHYARNFLIYSMNRFCADMIKQPTLTGWSHSIFFMDPDGIFDQELLGFPHATQSGLESLALLQSNGYSVVLNTGRSVEHVRNYCATYGIAGGIAEFGGVLVDKAGNKELPLVDATGARQLEKCRDAIRAFPGVFVDPGYRYSIRAYRYNGSSTAGLTEEEIRKVLQAPEFDRLSCISRKSGTHVVQKQTGRGPAVRFVKRYLGSNARLAAIGDSAEDIAMLEACDYAYATSGCSQVVRQFAKKGGCHVLKQYRQAALLEATHHRLRSDGFVLSKSSMPSSRLHSGHLIQKLLEAADRRPSQLLAGLISWTL